MTSDINDVLTMWTTAERTGDVRTLDTLLADGFIGVGPVGFVLDKAPWVGRFEHGLRYEQLDIEEVAIRRHGASAVVVARQHAVGDAGGTAVPSDTRVSFVIVSGGDGELKIAAMQYSFIGPPLGGPQ